MPAALDPFFLIKQNSKMKYILISLTVFFIFMISCYYDSEESLYPDFGDCDTLQVTYVSHIQGIVNNQCISCHGSGTADEKGAGIILDTYELLAGNLSVTGAIRHEPAYSPMPKDAAKLHDCLIRQFEIWEESGYPEN